MRDASSNHPILTTWGAGAKMWLATSPAWPVLSALAVSRIGAISELERRIAEEERRIAEEEEKFNKEQGDGNPQGEQDG